jgi:hypothetical protein
LSTIPKYTIALNIELNYRMCGMMSRRLLPLPVLDTIAPYLERFTVRSLTFQGWTWNPVSDEYKDDIGRWFAKITKLDLRRLNFMDPDHFFDLIASCHSLEILTFSCQRLVFSLNEPISSFTFPSHLHTIRLFLSDHKSLLSWLVSIARFPAIGQVELFDLNDVGEWHAVPFLLQSLRSSIHTLRLKFRVIETSTSIFLLV